jgi:hypothetical protein
MGAATITVVGHADATSAWTDPRRLLNDQCQLNFGPVVLVSRVLIRKCRQPGRGPFGRSTSGPCRRPSRSVDGSSGAQRVDKARDTNDRVMLHYWRGGNWANNNGQTGLKVASKTRRSSVDDSPSKQRPVGSRETPAGQGRSPLSTPRIHFTGVG